MDQSKKMKWKKKIKMNKKKLYIPAWTDISLEHLFLLF